MPVPRLLCSALIVATPLATLAQSTSPPPVYRFYSGMAAYASTTQAVGGYHGSRYSVPVQATLGYQLRPRLAVQVGLAYSNVKSNNSYTNNYVDSNANLISSVTTSDDMRRVFTTSLLARYTITRQAAHRFQVDALAGPSFTHSAGRSTYSETATSQGSSSASYSDYSYNYNDLLISAGPSFRYRFGKHLDAMYDVLLNVSLTNSMNGSTAMALGLRYRFGGLR
ncbi:outer membrane beta-barrel protein [Hymenobacter sp. BT559]|nr:outer membrane beta-barrel protein [Hymenobacter sp. BT559]